MTRLIVCLDGTWNKQDDSTNVWHHFNLVQEGNVGGAIVQRKQYFRGVGTGPLDRITGGGFGFGLEQNVRDAYNWLVETYSDGGGGSTAVADEIFLFGFSRGAYTARSLVGFIAACGLLKRAAPLTVNELWENYCVLGRKRELRQSIWEALFGYGESASRQLSELVLDPWLPPGRYQVSPPRTETERLLLKWSRRVKIQYLGIYDTVGAIGWDALAIPGLRSKLAVHHNMRPTTLINKCRHALAIDENRSSFRHTPFVAYLGHSTTAAQIRRGLLFMKPNATAESECRRTEAMWNSKIEQRWFVGAHSNIGGGYPDNLLSQRPFEWLLDGAKKVGLACQAYPALTFPTFPNPIPRDSYAEFVKPLWETILRAKRHYRVIAPHPQCRADRNRNRPGFVLKSINEVVDDSVFAYYAAGNSSPPPNLVEYARRTAARATGPHKMALQALANRGPTRPKLKPAKFGAEVLVLLLWASLGAAGLAVGNQVFAIAPAENLALLVLPAAALALCAIDRVERSLGFSLAFKGGGALRRSILGVLFWLRAQGCVLFFFGVAGFLFVTTEFIYTRIAHWFGTSRPRQLTLPPTAARLAGAVLLLQTGLIYVLNSLSWVRKPLKDANLGGLFTLLWLRLRVTPSKMAKFLDIWLDSLRCRPKTAPEQGSEKPEPSLGVGDLEPVRESLWRDILGFVPLYSVVLGFGSWLAGKELGGPWLRTNWFIFPVYAAVTNYFADFLHLHCLSFHRKRMPIPSLFSTGAFLMTFWKYATILPGIGLSLLVISTVTLRILREPVEFGWRGLTVLSVSAASVVGVLGILISAAVYRILNRSKTVPKPPPDEHVGTIPK